MAAPRRSDRRPTTVSRRPFSLCWEKETRDLFNGNRGRLKSPLWLIYLLARSVNRWRAVKTPRRRAAPSLARNFRLRDEPPPPGPFTLEVREKSMIHYRGYDWSPAARYANHFAPAPSYPFHIHPDSSWFTRAYPREQRRERRAPLVYALNRNSSSLCADCNCDIITQPAGRDPSGDHVAATWSNAVDDKPPLQHNYRRSHAKFSIVTSVRRITASSATCRNINIFLFYYSQWYSRFPWNLQSGKVSLSSSLLFFFNMQLLLRQSCIFEKPINFFNVTSSFLFGYFYLRLLALRDSVECVSKSYYVRANASYWYISSLIDSSFSYVIEKKIDRAACTISFRER